MSQFDDLFWLVEVAEAGTLTAAAEKQGVTIAAVSKRIRSLEERLGVRLLNRNTRHLSLTEAGALYYQRGKRILEELQNLEENVVSTTERLSGDIRINSPLTFSLRKLSPIFYRFQEEHPSIQIALHLEDRFIDIHNSDYDLIIRIGKLTDSSVVAQRLSNIHLICCATKEYLERKGTPKVPGDLYKHNCLEYEQINKKERWFFQKEGATYEINPKGNFRTNNGDMLLQTILAHQGIGLLPDFIADEPLRNKQLVPILSDYQTDILNVYAIYPSRNFLPAKIKKMIEFLRTELQEY